MDLQPFIMSYKQKYKKHRQSQTRNHKYEMLNIFIFKDIFNITTKSLHIIAFI